MNAYTKANVSEDINQIDARMKAKMANYKVFDPKKALEQVNNTANSKKDIDKNSKNNYVFEKYGMDADEMAEEMERLRDSEKEARDEVYEIMKIMRRQRMFQKMKEVLTQQRHDFKVDNLHQQLTSNSTLWEQLAESEKREKVLQQELNRLQYELATQEKMIERLKDQIKLETRDK